MNFLFWLFYALLFLVSVFLVLLVLIQKGRGGGLSSAFGGGGGGSTAFGSKTGDVLTWATSIVFGVFMLLSIGLVLVSDYRNAHSGGTTTAVTTPATPAAPGSPAAP